NGGKCKRKKANWAIYWVWGGVFAIDTEWICLYHSIKVYLFASRRKVPLALNLVKKPFLYRYVD
ncbi:MAG: hypothetical protein ACYS29_14285, partial [Planctomycetota bacterium]